MSMNFGQNSIGAAFLDAMVEVTGDPFRARIFRVFLEAHEKSKLEGGEDPLVAARRAATKFINEQKKKGGVSDSEESEEAAESAARAHHSINMLIDLKVTKKIFLWDEAINAHTAIVHSFLKGQKTSELADIAKSIVLKMVQSQFKSQ